MTDVLRNAIQVYLRRRREEDAAAAALFAAEQDVKTHLRGAVAERDIKSRYAVIDGVLVRYWRDVDLTPHIEVVTYNVHVIGHPREGQ